MTDIELVIKIPMAIYEASQILDVKYEDTIQIPLEVIAKGVPLPKGHGDLIDRSKLEPDCYELEIHDGEDWRTEYCGVLLTQIREYAEVIVEADRSDTK